LDTAKQNFRVQLWISILSVVLLVGKLIAYFFTHSLSILTDALESIVNVLAGVIGLYSLYIAAKPRDKEHPYGHGKAEFISAAVEGTLIVLAGVLIMYETVRSVLDDAQVHKLDTGLILVGITALLNYIAGTVCIRIGKKNQSLALQASGKHLQTDTYSTLAIILGLLLMLFTGLAWIDKALAAVMSIYIMYNGYQIVRASLAGIMDEADMALLQRFVDVLNANRQENWIDLHNLRVIKYGITLHIDCHLTVPWYLNIHEAHQEIDQLGAIIRQEFGDAIELFVHTDGCLPFSCRICSKTQCEKRLHPKEETLSWNLNNLLSNAKHQSSRESATKA